MFTKLIRFFTARSPNRTLQTCQSASVSGSRNLSSPLFGIHDHTSFRYTGENRGDFYRFLRDRIPIVSSGIWTWVHLCATPQRRGFTKDHPQNSKADHILNDLNKRIFPRRDGDSHGLERLTEAFFLELFTLGRFGLVVNLLPDASGIKSVELIDPYHIRWQRDTDSRLLPFKETEDGELQPINPSTFFHRTLITDLHQPHGIDPLASIPFVVEIEQKLLEDMAMSSHNAGTPRLQVKIAPPQRLPGEDPDGYHERINRYFETTVSQFGNLGPDDNIFTWSDVEVQVVGGGGVSTGWKINREQVIEDVITGLKLFPWALGRSHGTTKNWIYAQYNLLMQIVDSVQQLGADLAEWLMTLELRLSGNLATPKWTFAPNQDPFVVERNRARLMEFQRIDQLVEKGYISKEQGARELGYEKTDPST